MARVTVEDCVQKVPNRFELVLLAAQRARNISRGEELTVDRDNDKNPVVALREIADETIELPRIEQDLIKSLSRSPEPEPADEEVLDLIPTDQNIFGLQDVAAEEEAAGLPAEDGRGPVARRSGSGHRGGTRRPSSAVTGDERRGLRRRHEPVRADPRWCCAGQFPAARRPRRTAQAARAGRASRQCEADPENPRLRSQGRHRADRRRLRPRRAGARHPAPRQRRPLFHPSRRRRRHPGRLPARYRLDRHRAAARRGRGHADQAAGDRGPVRQGNRRPGRRRHQADAAGTAIRPHQAGGEFPQARPGHEPRHPRAAGQAGRPAAQHAHPAFRPRPGPAQAHRARNDGDLRAARRAHRHGRGQDRAADAGVHPARTGSLRHHPGPAELPARAGRRRHRRRPPRTDPGLPRSRRRADRDHGPREIAVLDLGEDAPPQRRVRAAVRHHGVPHRGARPRPTATRRWARCTRPIR